MRRSVQLLFPLLLVSLLCSGCGTSNSPTDDGGSPAGAASQPAPVAEPTVRVVEAKDLAWDAQRAIPGRDGGRVEVSPPKDWEIPPASEKYIVWFALEARSPFPRILVTAEPAEGIETVTEENLLEFTKAFEQEIEEIQKANPAVKVIERVMPMVIGGRPCVRYVRLVKSRGNRIQRQILITHVNGRRYTVELLVLGEEPEDLKQFKDTGYAVLAGMKFN